MDVVVVPTLLDMRLSSGVSNDGWALVCKLIVATFSEVTP